MWFVTCYIDKRKRKESRPGVKSAVVTTGWLEKVEMKEWKKERTKGEMSGVFVGVFQVLKKERNDSKKERKIEEIESFVNSQRRRRHQKKVKQGEICPRNDFKSCEYNYFKVFLTVMCLRRKIFPKLKNVPIRKKFEFIFFNMIKNVLGLFSSHFMTFLFIESSVYIEKKNAILLFFIHLIIWIFTDILYKILSSLLTGLF